MFGEIILEEEGDFSVGLGWIFSVFITLVVSSFIEAKDASKEVTQYLIPEDHPIKPALDALFSSSRATFNLETLEKAGFIKTKPRKYTKLIVTKHAAIPGYVFKLYLDAQRYRKDLHEHFFWIKRIQGAEKIRSAIAERGIEDLFKVPHKWIYALPKFPAPPKDYQYKSYILVEEDMDVLSDRENEQLWASDFVTDEHLDHLFYILKKIGLRDCVKPGNIPFSSDGRIAFIDTQSFDEKVIYSNFLQFLSKSNRNYWKIITE